MMDILKQVVRGISTNEGNVKKSNLEYRGKDSTHGISWENSLTAKVPFFRARRKTK